MFRLRFKHEIHPHPIQRFNDSTTETRALGFLAGRFSFTSWESGETLVPESALAALAIEGISFTVVDAPTYAQTIPAL